MHTDLLSMSASRSLAAAMQDTSRASCAWCEAPFDPAVALVGVFCSTACRDAEMAQGSGPALRSAHQVEQDRRKSSIAPCGDCTHVEKGHGSISGACLQKVGGRFDGASDQRRCACRKFVAAVEAEAPTEDVLTDDLFQQLVVSRFAQLDAEIKRLKQKVSDLEGRERVA